MLLRRNWFSRIFIFSGIIFLFSSFVVPKQIANPVQWKTSVKKINAMEFDIVFTAQLDKDWHIYSQEVISDGPVPTSFNFEENENYLLTGRIKETGNPKIDEMWKELGFETKAYKDKVSFTQRIKLKSKKSFTLNVTTEYMVCNKSCIPDSRSFSFLVKPEIK